MKNTIKKIIATIVSVASAITISTIPASACRLLPDGTVESNSYNTSGYDEKSGLYWFRSQIASEAPEDTGANNKEPALPVANYRPSAPVVEKWSVDYESGNNFFTFTYRCRNEVGFSCTADGEFEKLGEDPNSITYKFTFASMPKNCVLTATLPNERSTMNVVID